jgi:hypothetical protein
MTERMEALSQVEGDVDRIVGELDVPLGVLPEDAIEAARRHRELIIPRLIALIDATPRCTSRRASWQRLRCSRRH